MMSLSNQWVNNLVRINLDQNHLFLDSAEGYVNALEKSMCGWLCSRVSFYAARSS